MTVLRGIWRIVMHLHRPPCLLHHADVSIHLSAVVAFREASVTEVRHYLPPREDVIVTQTD